MKRLPRLPVWTVLRPLARCLDQWLPFVSFRLSAALRVSGNTEDSEWRAEDWWNQVLTVGAFVLIVCIVLAFCMNDTVWLWIGLIASAGYPIIRYRSEMDKLDRYREQMTYDLPEFVQIVVIYLYAGLTVSAAVRSTAARWQKRSGPLPEIIREASRQLSLQAPLTQVLHQMAVRADTNDMKTIVTILLTHTTRGGDAMIDTLLDISRQMWNKRLSLVRKRAEETTVKMVFPMILIFAAILVIVGAPAVIFMSA